MAKLSFSSAQFLLATLDAKQFPQLKSPQGKLLPEIAIVGRSNVGKSSLINHLLQNKHLAKTSSTPGKTQTVNFYLIDEQLILVDLPGYGYAQLAQTVKKQWAQTIDQYLKARSSLALVLFLMDIRRTPATEDLDFLQWALFYRKPVLILFTKSDKLNASEQEKQSKEALRMFKELLPEAACDHILYSIKEAHPRKELITRLSLRIYGTDQ